MAGFLESFAARLLAFKLNFRVIIAASILDFVMSSIVVVNLLILRYTKIHGSDVAMIRHTHSTKLWRCSMNAIAAPLHFFPFHSIPSCSFISRYNTCKDIQIAFGWSSSLSFHSCHLFHIFKLYFHHDSINNTHNFFPIVFCRRNPIGDRLCLWKNWLKIE